MSQSKNGFPATWSIDDLCKHLGRISPQRIRLNPLPGSATEKDLLRIEQQEGRLFELVDGVLVEKIMGFTESTLAIELGYFVRDFLDTRDLGFLAGADGAIRLMKGLVRIPDLSFISWEQVPQRVIPEEPIPDLHPDLAIEILSKGNRKAECERKLKEYFLSGAQLVWFVDPKKRTVEVFTSPDASTVLNERQTLDGGDVLPGFQLPLRKLFGRIAKQNKAANGRRAKRGNSKS